MYQMVPKLDCNFRFLRVSFVKYVSRLLIAIDLYLNENGWNMFQVKLHKNKFYLISFPNMILKVEWSKKIWNVKSGISIIYLLIIIFRSFKIKATTIINPTVAREKDTHHQSSLLKTQTFLETKFNPLSWVKMRRVLIIIGSIKEKCNR